MNIRYKYSLCLFCLIFISGGFININPFKTEKIPRLSTADNIDDPANDVVVFDNSENTCESTSLYPGLDIDSMVRSGQEITVTLYENFVIDDNYYHSLTIEDDQETYFAIYLDQFGVILTKEGGGTWDGSEFSTSNPVSVGSLSGKIFSVNIPSEAISITSSTEWVFMYTYDDDSEIMYLDICPNEELADLCPDFGEGEGDGTDGDGNGDQTGGNGDRDDDSGISDFLKSIPGYELTFFFLFSALFTIGLTYIVKNRRLNY